MRLSFAAASLLLSLVVVSPLRAHADDIPTHIQKANAAAEKKDWDVVLSELDAVLALDKNNIAAHSGKAVVLVQKQDLKGAIAELDQVIQIDPKNAGAYNMRASLYQQSGDKDKAQSDYVEFLRLSPDDAVQLQTEAQAATDKEDWQHAAGMWSMLAELKPNDARVLYERGEALTGIVPLVIMNNVGKDDMQANVDKITADAKASFEAAIKADPKFLPPYLALNDPALIEQGLKVLPDSPELLVSHARSSISFFPTAEQINAALAEYTHALQIDPKNAPAFAGRGLVYQINHQYDLALADYTSALELKPDDMEVLARRADIYSTQGDYKHSIADYDRVNAAQPDDSVTEFERYYVLTHLSDNKRALEAINKLITDDPKNLTFLQARAEFYFAQKDYAHALEDAKKAQQMAPESKDAADLLAKIAALPK